MFYMILLGFGGIVGISIRAAHLLPHVMVNFNRGVRTVISVMSEILGVEV